MVLDFILDTNRSLSLVLLCFVLCVDVYRVAPFQLLHSVCQKSKQEHELLATMAKLIAPMSGECEDDEMVPNQLENEAQQTKLDDAQELIRCALAAAEAETAQLKLDLQHERNCMEVVNAATLQLKDSLQREQDSRAAAVAEVADLKLAWQQEHDKTASADAEATQLKLDLQRERDCAAVLADELHRWKKDHDTAVEQCKVLSTRLMSKMGMADAGENDVKRLEETVHNMKVHLLFSRIGLTRSELSPIVLARVLRILSCLFSRMCGCVLTISCRTPISPPFFLSINMGFCLDK
jgi:hypothetical protein